MTAHGTATRDRVSVVMPAFNAAATLGRAMRSVLAQTHRELELIVVDDASTDATARVIAEVAAGDRRVVALRQERNAGVAAARNAGLAAASGAYVAFLDSDDWWHPMKLQVQLAWMRNSGSRASYTSYSRVDEVGRQLSVVQPPPEVGHADMLRSNRIGNLTGLYDRRLGDPVFQRVGHEDYVFWLQVVRAAGRATLAAHSEPLAYYQVRRGSLSADKWRAARWQWRIYRDNEGLGWLPASWYFLNYAALALAKRHAGAGRSAGQ